MSGLALDPFPTLESSLVAAGRVLLFLDFDGTLAPIVARPELAALSERSRKALQVLSRLQNATVAIVSGRELGDLRARIGLPLIYAGNHGLEIQGPGFEFRAPGIEPAIAAFDAIQPRLAQRLRDIPGALIENKGLTLGAHFRLVAPPEKALVEQIVTRIADPYLDVIRLHQGKEIVELRPRTEWNKGMAARWIRDRLGADGLFTLCAGDDVTDEDMFRALPQAFSVKVGSGPTAARFQVAEPEAISRLLEWVAAALSAPSKDSSESS